MNDMDEQEVKDQKRRQQIAVYVEQVKNGSHPALTGSQKQIDWATKIRTSYLEWAIAQINFYERAGGDPITTGLPTLLHNAFVHLRHAEASYWINNRSDLK